MDLGDYGDVNFHGRNLTQSNCQNLSGGTFQRSNRDGWSVGICDAANMEWWIGICVRGMCGQNFH